MARRLLRPAPMLTRLGSRIVVVLAGSGCATTLPPPPTPLRTEPTPVEEPPAPPHPTHGRLVLDAEGEPANVSRTVESGPSRRAASFGRLRLVPGPLVNRREEL